MWSSPSHSDVLDGFVLLRHCTTHLLRPFRHAAARTAWKRNGLPGAPGLEDLRVGSAVDTNRDLLRKYASYPNFRGVPAARSLPPLPPARGGFAGEAGTRLVHTSDRQNPTSESALMILPCLASLLMGATVMLRVLRTPSQVDVPQDVFMFARSVLQP